MLDSHGAVAVWCYLQGTYPTASEWISWVLFNPLLTVLEPTCALLAKLLDRLAVTWAKGIGVPC